MIIHTINSTEMPQYRFLYGDKSIQYSKSKVLCNDCNSVLLPCVCMNEDKFRRLSSSQKIQKGGVVSHCSMEFLASCTKVRMAAPKDRLPKEGPKACLIDRRVVPLVPPGASGGAKYLQRVARVWIIMDKHEVSAPLLAIASFPFMISLW